MPLEELREAVAAGRLTLLPVERAIAGDGPRYTPREISERTGIDLDLLARFRAALGVPYGDPDERIADRGGPGSGGRTKALLDAGLPAEGLLQMARTVGMGDGPDRRGQPRADDPHPDPARRHRARRRQASFAAAAE